MNGRRIARRVSGMFVGALAALVFMSLQAAPASAVTVSGSSGYPGTATAPLTYGQYGGYSGNDTITVPWRTAYPSTAYAKYNQWVCVNPQLWQLVNGNNG